MGSNPIPCTILFLLWFNHLLFSLDLRDRHGTFFSAISDGCLAVVSNPPENITTTFSFGMVLPRLI